MTSRVRDIVVYGAGGMGREAVELVQDVNDACPEWNILGFVDDDTSVVGREVAGTPVLGTASWLRSDTDALVVLAIGSPATRLAAHHRARDCGRALATIIHPTAHVGRRVSLGPGAIVAAGAILTTDIVVGTSVIINVGSTVSHDDVLEDYVTIAPGAHLAGAVVAREGTDIGTGASVIPGRELGAWSRVGAGSVVIKDVPPKATVVGNPARALRLDSSAGV